MPSFSVTTTTKGVLQEVFTAASFPVPLFFHLILCKRHTELLGGKAVPHTGQGLQAMESGLVLVQQHLCVTTEPFWAWGALFSSSSSKQPLPPPGARSGLPLPFILTLLAATLTLSTLPPLHVCLSLTVLCSPVFPCLQVMKSMTPCYLS